MSNDTENITRLDERMKVLLEKQHELEERLDNALKNHGEDMQKVGLLEAKMSHCVLESKGDQYVLDDIRKSEMVIVTLDKRISAMETASWQSQDRWKQFLTFIIQLAWVVLAAWLLTKLNLAGVNMPGSP